MQVYCMYILILVVHALYMSVLKRAGRPWIGSAYWCAAWRAGSCGTGTLRVGLGHSIYVIMLCMLRLRRNDVQMIRYAHPHTGPISGAACGMIA